MVFTDAPYGYKYLSKRQKTHKVLLNDDTILDYIPSIYDYMKDNTALYSFCSWQTLRQWLNYFSKTKLKLKNLIVWKKNNWSMGDLKGSYAGQHEIILFLHKGRALLQGKREPDVWEFKREPPTLHPTMKPLELCRKAILNSSKCGDVVLDIFGGSGSTLIACEQLNRSCYMMELEPKYCDVIIKRWEGFTGEKARRLN